MHYKLSGFSQGKAEALRVCVCVCSFICVGGKGVREWTGCVTGCDGRQFMLLCLNCHLMCMQSGTLTKKDTSSPRTTWMRCEDKQLWSDPRACRGGCDQFRIYNLHKSAECEVCCLWLDNQWFSLLLLSFLTEIPLWKPYGAGSRHQSYLIHTHKQTLRCTNITMQSPITSL